MSKTNNEYQHLLGNVIDELVKDRDEAWKNLDILRKRNEDLTAMLKMSTTRLDICLGRFAGCNENDPTAHLVSLEEIPAWVKEQRDFLDEFDPPTEQEVERRFLKLVLEDQGASVRVKRAAREAYEGKYGVDVEGNKVQPVKKAER
jgi:hypothetical protein